MYINIYTHTHIWISIHIYFYLFSQLRGSKRNDTPVAMNTPRAQILVYNTIHQQKEPGILVEEADSRNRVDRLQYEPRTLCSSIKLKKKKNSTKIKPPHINAHMSKGYQSQRYRAINGQSCNTLSNKVNKVVLYCNPKYKIFMIP